MRLRRTPSRAASPRRQRGSVLVIVLWVCLGLVTLTLYFAQAMSLDLRASDHRVSGLAADQAIEGAGRYVSHVLTVLATNGAVPATDTYLAAAVPVGNAHFWLLGRQDPLDPLTLPSSQASFGLVDEGSKLNLNTATAAMLLAFTNMTEELAANIVDWRNTNGTVSEYGDGPTAYSTLTPPYQPKYAPFETVDELRLVFGLDMDLLEGEDLNRNGALDAFETDLNRNGVLDPGLLEYVTIYSSEPNADTNGTPRYNVSGKRPSEIASALERDFGLTKDRANQIAANLGPPNTQVTFRSPLDFYLRSRMTAEEFAHVGPRLRVTGGTNAIVGRVNVNTASAAVLSALPGLDAATAFELVNYRLTNPDQLTSLAWVAEALRNYARNLETLRARDLITTESYQFSADIAALGPHGRGYRRVKMIFDISDGTPRVLYRQDLGHLGWALGAEVRHTWVLAQNTSTP